MNKNQLILLLATASLITLQSRAAYAQSRQDQNGNPGDVQSLETVTIRSTRSSLDDRFNAPGSRVIVTKDDIEAMGADTISDVIRQLPGVVATQGADGRTEIRMRGMDRNATQILIDGERQSNARRGGQLPIDQIPADLIERVEVIRSPMAEFSGASGGTINIVLKSAVIQRETNVRLSNQYLLGQNAAQLFLSRTGPLYEPPANNKDLPLDQRVVPPSYFFGMSVYERVGGNDRNAQVTTSALPSNPLAVTSEESREEASRSRTREAVFFPRMTVKLSSKDSIAINPFLVVGQSSTTINSNAVGQSGSSTYNNQSNERNDIDRYQGRLSTTWTHRLASAKVESRFFFEKGHEQTDRIAVVTGATLLAPTSTRQTSSRDERDEKVWSLSSKISGVEETHVWTIGGEYEHRGLTASTVTTSSVTPSLFPALTTDQSYISNQDRISAFGQYEWTVFKDGTLTGGLRVERLNRETDSAGTLYTDASTRLQPSLNLRLPIDKESQARIGLARNSRIPALLDIIDRTVPSAGQNSSTRPDAIGNPLLKPEQTLSLDAGWEYRNAKGIQGGINGFVRDISDPIIRPTSFVNGRWIQRPENGLKGQAWGIETDLRMPLGLVGLQGWNMVASASWLASKVDLTGGSINNNQGNVQGRIPGQPHYVLNINVAKPIPRSGGFFGGGTLNINGASSLGDSATGSGTARATARLDLNVGYVLDKVGFIRLGVNNVTDSNRQRVRFDTDGVAGTLRTESITDSNGRGVFLSVGTRF